MTEAELQAAVIDLARLSGWLVHHDRPARTDKGWRTAIQGDPGFPDLLMARDGIVLAVELKSATGKLSDHQRRWLAEMGGTVWRPDDWHEGRILAALRRIEG